MNFVIHGRAFKPESKSDVQAIFDELQAHQISSQISSSFGQVLLDAGIQLPAHSTFSKPEEITNADFAISLGGDGSFLETLGLVAYKETPILGINFGRLGFLTDIQPTNFKSTMTKLLAHEYTLDERIMVQAEASEPIFESGMNFALNEFAIAKTDTSSMIVIHAYIDGEFLNSYWADGLMVATPTGSTGYNLSCGGPLIMPQSDNFIITPICPHNLFVRPIIVSSQSEIKLKVESRSNNFLVSMDSRAKIVGDHIGEITIRIEKFKAKLVKLDGSDFLSTLREKLSWGKDVRNRI
jgi:NAD+ kinase